MFTRPMFTRRQLAFVSAPLSLFFGSAVVRAAYVATDLTPAAYSDGQATGVVPGSQGGFATNGTEHAMLWSGSSIAFVDMNPTSPTVAANSDIFAVTPHFQVGQATFGSTQQAAIWSGTANSFAALPSGSGFTVLEAHGAAETADGPVVVGFGTNSGNSKAVLWTKISPFTFGLTDLHSSLGTIGSYDFSFARATDGVTIAGQAFTTGSISSPTAGHAIVWNVASPHVATDINGTFANSDARGVSGSEVVGYASDVGPVHAILWNHVGAAYVPTDLNPVGAEMSLAYGTNGSAQVGLAVVDATGDGHAFLWTESGSTVTGTDLQASLDSSIFVSSQALGIADNGDIVGLAMDTSGNSHAILWTVSTPEPASLGVVGAGGILLIRRRIRR